MLAASHLWWRRKSLQNRLISARAVGVGQKETNPAISRNKNFFGGGKIDQVLVISGLHFIGVGLLAEQPQNDGRGA